MSRHSTMVCLAALAFAAAGTGARPCRAEATADQTVASLLRQARAANGADRVQRDTVIVARGRCTRLGVESGYTLAFTPGGRFLEQTDGPLGETAAYDGREFWAADSTGITRKLELGDEELASAPIWVATGRWCGEKSPFEIRREEPSAGAGNETLQLREKKGQLTCRLTIAGSTRLPAELRYSTSSGAELWRFEDYSTNAALAFPSSITHKTGPLIETYRIESVITAPAGVPTSFRRPRTRPTDTAFDPAVSARIESVRAPSGHTLIHPLVNGKDVGWFFLDTGAEAMCITPQAAEAAGMSKVGKVVVSGVGGSTTGSFRTGASFRLGPVSVEGLTFLELDLSFLAGAFKQKIAGVCGYDLFARCVLSLQPSTGFVEIHDPDKFRLARGRWRELYLHEKNAAVKCRFEGDREEVFRMDTGAGDTVSFHSPAVKRLNLLDGRETQASQSGGVGGVVGARQGKLEWFEVGGHRFENPTVIFSLAETGSFADPYTAGNVGQAFLRPFTVVFDYGRKRVAFIQNREDQRPEGGRKQ